MKEKKLTRSRDNRVLAGVCGGLAEYFGMDVRLMRVIVVLLAFFTRGWLILLAYIICALAIPYGDGAGKTTFGDRPTTPPPSYQHRGNDAGRQMSEDARRARDAEVVPPGKTSSRDYSEEEMYKESRKQSSDF